MDLFNKSNYHLPGLKETKKGASVPAPGHPVIWSTWSEIKTWDKMTQKDPRAGQQPEEGRLRGTETGVNPTPELCRAYSRGTSLALPHGNAKETCELCLCKQTTPSQTKGQVGGPLELSF